MKSLKRVSYILVTCCLFASCAISYKPINPPTLHYSQADSNNFAYKYDVLGQSNNRKLAKKEMKSQIRIVAVRIYNNTAQTLKYGVNYIIYSGDRVGDILPIPEATKYIRETVPLYLLYLLFTPTTLNINSGTSSNSFPIGLILGPALTLLNVGVAATANKHFREEMEAYDILEKEIKPGETSYGLIAIQSNDYSPLSIKWTGN